MAPRRAHHRRLTVIGALASVLLALGPGPAVSAQSMNPLLTADLDGRIIALSDVGRLMCEDFDFPRIHCFTREADLSAEVTPILSTTAVNYVVVFENPLYSGAYMYMSQDYTILAFIGWNDRISSFKAQNNERGNFWTNWFYGGTRYDFCCNQNVAGLDSFNDTFSSVKRI